MWWTITIITIEEEWGSGGLVELEEEQGQERPRQYTNIKKTECNEMRWGWGVGWGFIIGAELFR